MICLNKMEPSMQNERLTGADSEPGLISRNRIHKALEQLGLCSDYSIIIQEVILPVWRA